MVDKWHGNERQYTPNELNFMVRAVNTCAHLQLEGQCKPSAEACAECKWKAGVEAARGLDALTQSRVQDKADMMDILLARSEAYTKWQKRKDVKSTWGIVFSILWLVVLFVFIANAGCETPARVVNHRNNGMRYEGDMRRARPDRPGALGIDYVPPVKKALRLMGGYVRNWNWDGVVNCQDYCIAFFRAWYLECKAPPGTCLIARNVNVAEDFDHVFILYWDGKAWQPLEPMGYKQGVYTPAEWWGSVYDERKNVYCQTDMFLCTIAGTYLRAQLLECMGPVTTYIEDRR